MSGSERLSLSALPIFRALNGSFDPALMNLESLFERASAAMDQGGLDWMRELRANHLHSWLEKNLPRTMSHAPAALVGRIRFSLDVLSVLVHLDARKMMQRKMKAGEAKKRRADKKRDPAIKGIAQIEDALNDGVLVLSRGERSLLRQLHAKAKAELAAKRAKSEKHPALIYLAQILALQGADKRARAASILELAEFAIIECEATTAGRYAGMAGMVGSPAAQIQHAMDRSQGWHLLDVLEQNR